MSGMDPMAAILAAAAAGKAADATAGIVTPTAYAALSDSEKSAIEAVRANSGAAGNAVWAPSRERVMKGLNRVKEIIGEDGYAKLPRPYALGTLLNSTGVNNWQKIAKEMAERDLVSDGADKMEALIAAEDRRDTKVKVGDLAMRDDGTINVGGDAASALGTVAIEQMAAEKLSTLITPGGARYLSLCPADLRAINFNYWAAEEADKVVTFRHRKAANGARQVFTTVGGRYAAFDVNQVARVIRDVIGSDTGARLSAEYDGTHWRFDLSWMSPVAAEVAAAGEVYRVGLAITGADIGGVSIESRSVIDINHCRNIIVVSAVKGKVTRKVHVGTPEVMAESVKAAIKAAHADVATWATEWAAASKDEIIGEGKDPAEIFAMLTTKGLVKVAGIRNEDMANRLMTAWRKEPLRSRKGILQAITREAHEGWHPSPWTRTEMEEQAGALLYNRLAIK